MNDRERNRREFPTAAAFVDRMRSVFGPGVRLRWWIENGKTIGEVPAVVSGGSSGENQINQAGLPAVAEHGSVQP